MIGSCSKANPRDGGGVLYVLRAHLCVRSDDDRPTSAGGGGCCTTRMATRTRLPRHFNPNMHLGQHTMTRHKGLGRHLMLFVKSRPFKWVRLESCGQTREGRSGKRSNAHDKIVSFRRNRTGDLQSRGSLWSNISPPDCSFLEHVSTTWQQREQRPARSFL